MAPTDSTPDASQALMEAERLLGVLEKQVPALAALDGGLKPIIPRLREAAQAVRQLAGRSRSAPPSRAEVEGAMRPVQLASSQLKGQGAKGHSATVMKALGQVEALLSPLAKVSTRLPAVQAAASPPQPLPLPAPASEQPVAPPARPSPPAASPPPVRPRPPTGSLPAVPRPTPAARALPPAGLLWSVESLVVASLERRPLQPVASQAPVVQESGEEAAAPRADDTAPSAGLGAPSLQAGRARFSEGLLDLHLEQLSSAFAMREAQLNSGKALGTGLEALEAGFLSHTDALRWLGPETVPTLAERLTAAEEGGTAFALALPLLTIAGNDIAEAVERAARELVPDAAAGLVEALRFAAHPRLPQLLDAFSRPDAPTYLRVPAMGLLAQYGLWDEARARAVLAEDEPEVVAAAARAVLTCGQVRLLDLLEALLARGLEAPADTQVLITAAVLGAPRALERARARLAEEAVPPDSLIRLLAACGGKADDALLWRLAQGKGPTAKVALQALAWLGPADAVPRLRTLAEGESAPEEAVEGLRFLMGEAGSPPISGRIAHGSPWTEQVPLSLMARTSTSAQEREWAFWELAARTGAHAPFDPRWPWARQREAARGWQAAVQGSSRRLPAGSWLYRGRLLAKGDST